MATVAEGDAESYVGNMKMTKVEGFWFVDIFNVSIDDQLAFRDLQMGDDDILIASFPKSGTAWMERITSLLKLDVDVSKADEHQLDQMSLMLDRVGSKAVMDSKTPRIIKTHYPYDFIPRSFREGNGKVLYVTRNTKDVSVSLYFFHQAIKAVSFRGSFEDYFQLFRKGAVGYGPWWKHVRGYWEHRHEDNIKFVFYEDLQKEPKRMIKEIASFLGKPITDEQVTKIATQSSFDSMKKNPKSSYEWLGKDGLMDTKVSKYMRKGVIGDWKNFYSQEMNAEMDAIIEREYSKCGLHYCYE